LDKQIVIFFSSSLPVSLPTFCPSEKANGIVIPHVYSNVLEPSTLWSCHASKCTIFYTVLLRLNVKRNSMFYLGYVSEDSDSSMKQLYFILDSS